MGLLDELKSERSQIEKDAENAAIIARKKEAFYEQHLNPRMKKLYMFLYELCDHLRVLEQKIISSYTYPGLGQIDDFVQGEYRLSADSADKMKQIRLKFQCLREKPIKATLDIDKNGPALEDFLKNNHITYVDRKIRPNGMTGMQQEFEFDGYINADFEFKVDMDALTIEFSSYNFPEWGLKRLSFKAHELNSKIMDEMGRFLLRQKTDLFRTKLSEEELRNIQALTENAKKEHKKNTLLAKLYSPGQETPRQAHKEPENKKVKKRKSLIDRLLHKK